MFPDLFGEVVWRSIVFRWAVDKLSVEFCLFISFFLRHVGTFLLLRFECGVLEICFGGILSFFDL